MTAWHVKPEENGGVPAGSGTEADPWNGSGNVDWTASGVQPGDTLKGAGNFSGERLDIGGSGTNGSPITIDLSGAALESHEISGSGEWSEVDPANPTLAAPGSDFWILDTGLASASKITAVWFGADWQDGVAVQYWTTGTTTFTDVTPGNVPASDRELAFFIGGGGTNAHLGVYSVGNPVTYYGQVAYAPNTVDYRCVQAINRGHIVFNGGTFRRAARGITLFNVTGSTQLDGLVVKNAIFDGIDAGVHVDTSGVDSWIDGLEIARNTFSNIFSNGVSLSDYVRNADIHDNAFNRIGVTYSLGGVYLFNVLADGDNYNKIHSNTFTKCCGGYYWPGDGAGVGTDQNAGRTKIYQNTFRECWQAWHDNSGRENWFYANRIYDCAMMSHHVDSGGNNSAEVYLYSNGSVGMTADGAYNGSATDYKSIVRAENITYGPAGVNVKNNFFVGATGQEDALMRSEAKTADWDEDYNCVWNVANEVVDLASNAKAQGANARNVEPSPDANLAPHNSALIAAGVKVPGVDVGYDGIAYQPEPTIGPFEMFRRLMVVAARGGQTIRRPRR